MQDLKLLGWNMHADEGMPVLERSLSSTTRVGMFTKLARLRLMDLDVARGSHCSLLSQSDIPRLQELELSRCDHIGAFLNGLVSAYATTKGSLTSVLMILPWRMAERYTEYQVMLVSYHTHPPPRMY
jgi:hypothetical protein